MMMHLIAEEVCITVWIGGRGGGVTLIDKSLGVTNK